MGPTPPGGSGAWRRCAGLVLATAAAAGLAGCADGGDQPGAAGTTPSATTVASATPEPSTASTPASPAPEPSTTAPAPSATPPSVGAPDAPGGTSSPTLGFDHLGPGRLGMTMDEFGAALGMPVTLVESSGYADPCWFEWLGGVDSGVAVMSVEGRDGPVVRIDVTSSGADDVASLPRTDAGLGVGSTADDVRAAHAGRLAEEPHAYGGGLYLTVTDPAAPTGTVLVFETDDAGVVTSVRAGLADPVGFVEGCS